MTTIGWEYRPSCSCSRCQEERDTREPVAAEPIATPFPTRRGSGVWVPSAYSNWADYSRGGDVIAAQPRISLEQAIRAQEWLRDNSQRNPSPVGRRAISTPFERYDTIFDEPSKLNLTTPAPESASSNEGNEQMFEVGEKVLFDEGHSLYEEYYGIINFRYNGGEYRVNIYVSETDALYSRDFWLCRSNIQKCTPEALEKRNSMPKFNIGDEIELTEEGLRQEYYINDCVFGPIKKVNHHYIFVDVYKTAGGRPRKYHTNYQLRKRHANRVDEAKPLNNAHAAFTELVKHGGKETIDLGGHSVGKTLALIAEARSQLDQIALDEAGNGNIVYNQDRSFEKWIKDNCYDSWLANCDEAYCFWDEYFNLALSRLRPHLSKEHKGQISNFVSREDYNRGRRQSSKPGKFFRRLFPGLQDKCIAEMVTNFEDTFGESKWVFKTGKEESDFVEAYTKSYRKHNNFYTSSMKKALSNSCMQKGSSTSSWSHHNNLRKHPVTAYASGEFVMASLWDEAGLLAARAILHEPTKTYGPIYCCSDGAYTYLLSQINSMGYEGTSEEGEWFGAKLAVNHESSEYVILPYVDFYRGVVFKDGHFVIVDHSKYNYKSHASLGETRGTSYCSVPTGLFVDSDDDDFVETLPENMVICTATGRHINYDDSFTGPDGNIYCEDAYNELFFSCELSGDDCPIEELIEVHTRNSWNGGYSTMSASRQSSGWVVTTNGEYWVDSHTFPTYNDQYVSQRQLDDGEWEYCEETEELYPANMMVTIIGEDGCQARVNSDFLVNRPEYKLNDEGVYVLEAIAA